MVFLVFTCQDSNSNGVWKGIKNNEIIDWWCLLDYLLCQWFWQLYKVFLHLFRPLRALALAVSYAKLDKYLVDHRHLKIDSLIAIGWLSPPLNSESTISGTIVSISLRFLSKLDWQLLENYKMLDSCFLHKQRI